MEQYFRGKRILLTGGSGFLGSNLCRALLQQRSEVHLILRRGVNPWRIRDILRDVKIHTADLLDASGLQDTIHAIHPDLICHAAAERSGDHEALVGHNLAITVNLLNAISGVEYENCLCLGSSLEYGRHQKAIQEDFPLRPETPYATGKAKASEACRAFVRESGKPLNILRPFSVYGYGENPRHLIPTAIRACLKQEELLLTPPGFAHDYVFVEDVVDGCMKALCSEQRGMEWNLAGGVSTTNEEVVEIIQELMNTRLVIRPGQFPIRENDTDMWVGDPDFTSRTLGWKAATPIREGLEKTIRWIRDLGYHDAPPRVTWSQT